MFSKIKLISVISFIIIFFGSKILIMNSEIINFGSGHKELVFDISISAQKLLYTITIYLVPLCLGFGNSLNNSLKRVRYKNKKDFILHTYDDTIFISIFAGISMVLVQILVLIMNGLKIEVDLLFLSFSLILIYSFGFMSIYNLFYVHNLKHGLSLILTIAYKEFWLMSMFAFLNFGSSSHSIDSFYYKIMVIELIVVNILYIYKINKEDTLYIRNEM